MRAPWLGRPTHVERRQECSIAIECFVVKGGELFGDLVYVCHLRAPTDESVVVAYCQDVLGCVDAVPEQGRGWASVNVGARQRQRPGRVRTRGRVRRSFAQRPQPQNRAKDDLVNVQHVPEAAVSLSSAMHKRLSTSPNSPRPTSTTTEPSTPSGDIRIARQTPVSPPNTTKTRPPQTTS